VGIFHQLEIEINFQCIQNNYDYWSIYYEMECPFWAKELSIRHCLSRATDLGAWRFQPWRRRRCGLGPEYLDQCWAKVMYWHLWL